MVQGCFRSSRMLSRSGHLPTFCYAIQKYTNNVFLCSQKKWLHCVFTLQYPNPRKGQFSSVSLQRRNLPAENSITCPCLHQSLARVMELQLVYSNESVSPSWGGVCEKANTWTKSGLSYQGRKKVVKVGGRMTFGKMSATLILCFIKHRFTTILSST